MEELCFAGFVTNQLITLGIGNILQTMWTMKEWSTWRGTVHIKNLAKNVRDVTVKL